MLSVVDRKMTPKERTAMGEDSKVQIVSNDLIRRLQNNSESLGVEAKLQIVDEYSQKLANSGYKGEQLKKIICNGIKGYENKLRRCQREGRKLHRSSVDSQGARVRKKLLAKANWFKKKKKNDDLGAQTRTQGGPGISDLGSINHNRGEELKVKSILFVEQTPNGELAKRLRETLKSMEPTLGFRIKVVERAGQKLGSKFPLTQLWSGNKCGHQDFTTCEQGGEGELPQCTQKSLVYENLCVTCNPGATGKRELSK